MNTEIIPMDKLAKAYLKIRGAKSELTQKYEDEMAALDAQEDQLESATPILRHDQLGFALAFIKIYLSFYCTNTIIVS